MNAHEGRRSQDKKPRHRRASRPAASGDDPRSSPPHGHDGRPEEPVGGPSRRLIRPKRGRSTLARRVPAPRLYTATIVYADGHLMVQAFHASVAYHPAEVVQRLRARFGDDVVALAELRIGFYPAVPIAVAIVPQEVADMIRHTERDCTTPAALTFSVDIEQRIEI